MSTRLLLAVCASAAVGAACTVHQTEPSAVSGPSTFARSVNLTASPDRITWDGASQSSITVDASGPDGRPLAGLALRLDMAVPCSSTQPGCSGGAVQADYGTLSARTVVTGSDGKARAVYTAPPAPPPLQGGSGTVVEIGAIPIGNDGTGVRSVVSINLMPAGVILPPAETPTAAFKVSPASFTAGLPVLFDGSGSCGGALSNGACPSSSPAISSFAWNFGDGSTASGQTATHAFANAGSFAVTLTVTNARGISASTTQSITATPTAAPTAVFVISPTNPQVGQTIVFNADASRAAAGRTIVQYSWIFGDGATGSGFLASHAYAAAGTYNVTLSVLDDGGLKGTVSQAVTIGSGSGGGQINADFVFSPTDPKLAAGTNTVFFDATPSSSPAGITSYSWDFGDGSAPGSGQKPSHTYTLPATFVVRLTVTDAQGRTATITKNVTVGP